MKEKRPPHLTPPHYGAGMLTPFQQAEEHKAIRCHMCLGVGGDHNKNGCLPYCGHCHNSGFSTLPYDLERNGTTVTIPLGQSLEAAFPELIDVKGHGGNRVRGSDGKDAFCVCISWINPNFADRLEQDRQGKLYPVSYWEK